MCPRPVFQSSVDHHERSSLVTQGLSQVRYALLCLPYLRLCLLSQGEEGENKGTDAHGSQHRTMGVTYYNMCCNDETK